MEVGTEAAAEQVALARQLCLPSPPPPPLRRNSQKTLIHTAQSFNKFCPANGVIYLSRFENKR